MPGTKEYKIYCRRTYMPKMRSVRICNPESTIQVRGLLAGVYNFPPPLFPASLSIYIARSFSLSPPLCLFHHSTLQTSKSKQPRTLCLPLFLPSFLPAFLPSSFHPQNHPAKPAYPILPPTSASASAMDIHLPPNPTHQYSRGWICKQ